MSGFGIVYNSILSAVTIKFNEIGGGLPGALLVYANVERRCRVTLQFLFFGAFRVRVSTRRWASGILCSSFICIHWGHAVA
jgi:hypothetical protein